jgi:hypothetical protein
MAYGPRGLVVVGHYLYGIKGMVRRSVDLIDISQLFWRVESILVSGLAVSQSVACIQVQYNCDLVFFGFCYRDRVWGTQPSLRSISVNLSYREREVTIFAPETQELNVSLWTLM